MATDLAAQTKVCRDCKRKLTLDNFYVQKRTPRLTYYNACKRCTKTRKGYTPATAPLPPEDRETRRRRAAAEAM